MSELKPRGVPITLDGVERHFLFTLNAIDEIQDHYKKFDENGENVGLNLLQVLQAMTSADNMNDTGKYLRFVVMVLLNDEADRTNEFEEVTEKEVGEMISLENYALVMNSVLAAYGVSMPDADEDSEGEDPNGETGEMES